MLQVRPSTFKTPVPESVRVNHTSAEATPTAPSNLEETGDRLQTHTHTCERRTCPEKRKTSYVCKRRKWNPSNMQS
ncbi:hypothetical protein QQF64_003059 [Cirrhinus molitorella]|uniref:Uncharacterized protein n=1 Tax=Cirrhinus molitorella TaxID=172907 RepID=A0ABR3MKR7_9TELE